MTLAEFSFGASMFSLGFSLGIAIMVYRWGIK